MSFPSESCKEHTFTDFCNTSQHSQAIVASHLNNPVKGDELYNESYAKEKIKTINVALVVCLNMDIDPPDVQKIPPYSRVEAWLDPAEAGCRVVDVIGKNLQAQYERWQPKGCYRQCLDPNLEEVKKVCISMRRNARLDRILFHYNGHGVPRPTDNGEIWVFNRTFTKYIPLSLYDLQCWLGGPSVYVIECQNAGRVLKLYEYFCQRRQTEGANPPDANGGMPSTDGVQHKVNGFGHTYASHANGQMGQMVDSAAAAVAIPAVVPATMENTIMLCACEENEDLPQLAELPADLFTACLTTPIRTALRWHWMKYNRSFPGHVDEALLEQIPGTHGNRMSLLGEINWIFTAVTDTIAWCSFPVDLFQKLFRQDLLVASIFRNYLLAQRLMRAFGCHPCSWPRLAPTHDHPIWSAWDHSLDMLFHYLPQVIATQSSPQKELMLLQQQRQKHKQSLPLLLYSLSKSANGMGDVPRDLLEMTSTSTHRLTSLLGEIDRQVEEAKQKRVNKPEERREVEQDEEGDEQKSQTIAPPPGYESAASKSVHQGRGFTSLSPRKAPKFTMMRHNLSRISEEERATESSAPAAKPVAKRTQSHSFPSHLPHSLRARSSREQVEEALHHHQHHRRCDSEETEFSSSDLDVDEEDDESEDEEEEDDDLGAAHQHRSQDAVSKQTSGQLQLDTASTSEVAQQPPLPGLASTRSFRTDLYAAADDSSGSVTPTVPHPYPRLSAASLLARCSRPRAVPVIGPTPLPLVHDSAPLDYRPSVFFTSQMTAFQAWLHQTSSNHTAYRQRQSAIQLPILLQVLLSQTHRIRALQLLSEFLDLGAWAVSHCITVGILPYIVRLFHSNVLEVKPHLVFIWGKIISSAQIDFSRHEGIRESGYRYFVACLQDAANLSPLVRTMAAFALAKMLVRCETDAPDVLFQEVYFSSKPQSFIYIAAEELTRASAAATTGVMRDGHSFDHLKVWLLLALGRVWMHCDEARWLAVRADGGKMLETTIFPRLCDSDSVVRAAAVFALGTLINQPGTEGKTNLQEADRLNHQVGIRLVGRTHDPSPLVRCEVVVALRSLVIQCESRLVEQAHISYRDVFQRLQTASAVTAVTASGSDIPVGSPTNAAALFRGMAELGISRLGRPARSRSYKNLQHTAVTSAASSTHASDVVEAQDEVPNFIKDFEPNTPGGIFAQLWDTVLVLAADCHPSVAKLANKLFLHIVQELIRQGAVNQEVAIVSGRLHPLTPVTCDNVKASEDVQVNTPTLSSRQQQPTEQITPGRRLPVPENGEATADSQGVMKVQTEFFQWCSQWFSQPLLYKYPNALQIRSACSEISSPSMEPPSLSSTLSPRNLVDLSSISSDPKAHNFSDYLLRFKKHSAARHDGRRRWHAIATGRKPSASSSTSSSTSEIRHCMHQILHRASRAASPLSPTRRYCRHGNRFTDNAIQFCSSTVSPHVGGRLAESEAMEAAKKDEEVVNAKLQLLHILQAGPEIGTAVAARFHPYKPHLLSAEAVANGEEYAVSVWGVHRLERVHRLTLTEGKEERDRHAASSTLADALAQAIKQQRALTEAYDLAQVTSLEMLNTVEERSLLLTASRDGCIRVWQDYDAKSGATPRLLTAWMAIENQVPLTSARRTAGSGLVTGWSDCSPHHLLHVSGNVRFVRTFDTDCEALVTEINTHSNTPVTRLACATDGNEHIFAAGFADSAVKVFDSRLPSDKAIVFETVSDGHEGRVLDLAFASYQADRRLYAVTSWGSIGAWQLQSPSINTTWQSIVPTTAREDDASTHSATPTVAIPLCGIRAACLQVSLPCTRSHFVAYSGLRRFSVARIHDGQVIASYQPSQNLSFTAAAAIHPYEPLIAVGMSDASIHLLKFRLPSLPS